ncbi:MAG TPA: cardiolipin synthase ClsB [Burkholderiaceae bacterium]|nr:cardiolipin synthase ClsB [Burkholderiaceae bacterium]
MSDEVLPEVPSVQVSVPVNRLVLLTGGEALFAALIEAMDAAHHDIHLETYIFDFRRTPLRVAEAMVRAAGRGVAVRLVVDGVGTGEVPSPWAEAFDRAGVQVKVYAPLGRLGLLLPSRWRRLHRKLCVVDGSLGFCGGINLLDDYFEPREGDLQHPRFDFAVCCTGPLAQAIDSTMMQLWWRLMVGSRVRHREFKGAWQALRAAPGRTRATWSRVLAAAYRAAAGALRLPSAHPVPPPPVTDAFAQLVLRDNIWHRADIERNYLQAIAAARSEVLIANAYFVPGRRLRKALFQAVRRGVRVRVLLQGRYEGFMQYHAARPVYKQLLDAGVDIREYTPSALHAKVAVVDQRWATVGSSNLDPLSLLLAREANVVTVDPQFAADLRERLDRALTHGSRAIDHAALLNRPWHQRALDRIAFGLMRTLLFLTGHKY